MRIALAIATAGRREVLADTVDHLSTQSRAPDEFLICPSEMEDVDFERIKRSGIEVRIVRGIRGTSGQRNAMIEASNADVIVFTDDDYLMAPDFLIEVERLMSGDPSIVVATGKVLADGILTAGYDAADGERILGQAGANDGGAPTDIYNAYGCNMVVRLEPARANRLRFDENLPLYGWLEDVDFSRQLAPYGRVVYAPRLRGVHLGTKRSGRSPGRRLGYSQVANPIYLSRKGTMAWNRSLSQVARNLAANLVRSFYPEPWVDRRGRLHGNVLGLVDLVKGGLSPKKALNI